MNAKRKEDCSEEIARPAKRPRLGQGLPDGFAPSTSTVRHLVAAPKVQSEFDEKSFGNATRSIRPLGRPDFAGLVPKPATKPNGNKPLLPPRPPPPLPSISKPKNSAISSPMKLSGLRPILSQPNTFTRETKTTNARESKTSSMLHNPPVIRPRLTDSSLKPIPGPPLLPRTEPKGPPPISPSKLKTISTTRVAIATDPHAESVPSELFSLLLKQGCSTYVDAVDRELGRGLIQSPERNKNGGGKGKYIRGGLAEAFSRRFAQSNTDQKLWEEHTMRSYGDGKRRMKADLKLKTITLLHRSPIPANTSIKTKSPMVTLAKCLVLDSQTTEFKRGKEVTVLFRHSSVAKSTDIQLHGDVEVHVWRPWLQLSNDSTRSAGPLGTTSPVWLCSRFHVFKPTEDNTVV
ncbi:hypothetical protein BDY19DRAFT_239399 [Irpex rosettiformis]|uniref:Uncharacterized protein n=1 Tax=Irpex rosettiformis TaxID=378272 RepID=A0ACB8U056_9APHY|nr:hypothetical protein BDY19DRAFT_239399 [Irpex rosettiformis]